MKTSATIGATMIRNGIVPPQKPLIRVPALREPVGEVDDQRELRDLGRVDRRQRAELQPAGRAADDDRSGLGDEDEDEQHDRDAYTGDRHEPEIAVVDPHHRDHRDDAEGRPADLRADDREACRRSRCRPSSPSSSRPSGCRSRSGRRRSRGSRSRPGGAPRTRAVAFWRAGVRRATGRRSRSRPARPARSRSAAGGRRRGMRRREAHRVLPSARVGGERGDRLLERPTAGGVVDEHVEAGGGRAEQHGRRPARRRSASASRAIASARADRLLERRRALGPGRGPAARNRRLEVRPALADQDGGGGPLGDDRRRARSGRRPCRGRRRSGRSGASKARSAAITASGWVPCESLTNRTPSTSATVSRRCSTPRERGRRPRGSRRARCRTAAPTATAARAFETLCSPGIAELADRHDPAAGARSPRRRPRRAAGARRPSATIQPSTTPTPAGRRAAAPVQDGRAPGRGRRTPATTGSSALRTSAPSGSTSSASRRFAAPIAPRASRGGRGGPT